MRTDEETIEEGVLREDVILDLVRHHFDIEPELQAVYMIGGDRKGEPIKLLEVNAATVATGSVDIFTFAPTEGLPNGVQIAEVTPEELERLRAQPSALPRGWDLAKATLFERPKAAE